MTTSRMKLDTEFNSVRWDRAADTLDIEFKYDTPPHFDTFTIQPPGITQLVVERDEHYRLQGRLLGQGRYDDVGSFISYLDDRWKQTEAGTLVAWQPIKFPHGSFSYSISGHFFTKISVPQLVVKYDNLEECIVSYELGFSVNFVEAEALRIRRSFDGGETPLRKVPRIFSEWCTNAPEDKIGYKLRITKTISKVEVTTESEGQLRTLSSAWESNSSDHFRFQFHDFLVRVRFIDMAKYAPYSRKIAVEYYHDAGAGPTAQQRDMVIELLSFLFGRHLLSVGYSLFETLADEPTFDQIISYRGHNPWGDDLVIISRISSLPPINFDPYLIESDDENGEPILQRPPLSIEEFMEQFLPIYAKERADSGLADLLWGIWTAQPQSDNQRLPIYATALEKVVKAYLKSRKIVLEYLSPEHAKMLTAEVSKNVEAFVKKFELSELTVRGIRSKVSNFNNYSGNDRMKRFLSIIGLDLSMAESAAIRMRNAAAHGDVSVLSEKPIEHQQEISLAENAYRTLLHRVFLNIIGYKGNYVNYGELGYPEQDDDQLGDEPDDTPTDSDV